MTDLVFDPSTPGRAYAATGGNGVFRSDDLGSTWEPANAGLPLKIDDVAVGPKGVLYAVEEDAFSVVFRSDDAGETWMAGSSGLEGTTAESLAVDPVDGAIVYLATELNRGVYRSVDGGATWERRTDGLPSQPDPIFLVHHPQESGRLYFRASSSVVFGTDDGGGTWVELPWPFLRLLAIHPQNPDTMYGSDGFTETVYRTTDGGQTWDQLAGGLPENFETEAIALDPADPATLVLGGWYNDVTPPGEEIFQIFRSTDGAASWTQLPGALNRTLPSALAVEPTGSSIVLAGTHGGVRRSEDGGAAWTDANEGLTGLTGQLLAADPVRVERAFLGGGIWAGPWRSQDGGGSWALAIGDAPSQGVYGSGLAISPLNPDRVYRSGCGAVRRSNDGGFTWEEPVFLPFCISAIAAGGKDSEELWGGIEDYFFEGVPVLWRSTDGGETWEPSYFSSQNLVVSWFRYIVVDPTDGSRLLATYWTSGQSNPTRVIRSLDGGETWEETLVEDRTFDVLFLEVDPAQPTTWYVGVRPIDEPDRLLRSADSGATWEPVPHDLPCLEALAVDPFDSSLYAGCDRVYHSRDGGSTWEEFPSDGLPPDFGSVEALEIPPLSPRRIWAATNAGVYTFDFVLFADGFETGDTSAWSQTVDTGG